ILVSVRTRDGQTIDDVAVKALRTNEPGGDAGPAVTESVPGVSLGDGRFRVGPLAQGRYRVEVADGVNPPVQADRAPGGLVEVASGIVEATVTLDRGESLRGRVVDGKGQAVPDVWVSATCRGDGGAAKAGADALVMLSSGGSGRRVVSGPEGRFAIGGLAARELCTVRAEQPYGAVGLARDARPGDDVTVTLPALGTLSGTAVSDDGKPVDSLTLSVRDDATATARTQTVSASGGRWSLANMMPGQLQILASDGRGHSAQQRVELAPGQALAGVLLELRALAGAPVAAGDVTHP
ncbi:MAG: carboxypeptidase-like regulatory domain-containing protein, partial [Polyangiaceae bacterium]